jgi:hypothetical protein
MSGNRKIRLFDYEKSDLIFIGFLIILALWLFAPGLRAERIMLPFSDELFTSIDAK